MLNGLLFLLYYVGAVIAAVLVDRFFFRSSLASASDAMVDVLLFFSIAGVGALSFLLRDYLYFENRQPEGKKFRGFLVVIGSLLIPELVLAIGLLVYDFFLKEYWYVLVLELGIVVFTLFVSVAFFRKSRFTPRLLVLYFVFSLAAPIVYERLAVATVNPLRGINETYPVTVAYCLVALIYVSFDKTVGQVFSK